MQRSRIGWFCTAAIVVSMTLCLGATQASALDLPGDTVSKKASVSSNGWMTQGAEILPMGKKAFEFRVGFPSTDFGIHIPVLSFLEINPIWSIDYLPYGVWVGFLGDTFGFQIKGRVWSSGPHAISLGADFGLIMSYIPAFNIGVQIGGPELKYSYRWNNPRIAIIAGFRMPVQVWAIGVSANIPMLFNIGFEYNVTKTLNIHANFELGPNVCAGPGFAAIALFHAGFQFGISYLF